MHPSQAYPVRRISPSSRAHRHRSRRPHCTAPRCGRSRAAGTLPRTGVSHSLRDKAGAVGARTVARFRQEHPRTGRARGARKSVPARDLYQPPAQNAQNARTALRLTFTLLTGGASPSRWAKAVSGDGVTGSTVPAGAHARAVCAVAASGTSWREEDLELPRSRRAALGGWGGRTL